MLYSVPCLLDPLPKDGIDSSDILRDNITRLEFCKVHSACVGLERIVIGKEIHDTGSNLVCIGSALQHIGCHVLLYKDLGQVNCVKTPLVETYPVTLEDRRPSRCKSLIAYYLGLSLAELVNEDLCGCHYNSARTIGQAELGIDWPQFGARWHKYLITRERQHCRGAFSGDWNNEPDWRESLSYDFHDRLTCLRRTTRRVKKNV